MRLAFFALCFLGLAVTLVAAWSKEDQEIFRLRDEVEATEGEGVSFYDFLGVTPKANQEDLNKAWKLKSRTMHPDKVKRSFIANKATEKGKKGSKPAVHSSKGPTKAQIEAAHKAASDRYARLGLVNKVLEGAGRKRYDHFLANGFPKWKGTGYYYARFRPGFGSVLVGLFVFVGGAGHYLALYMSWKRQQDFLMRYINFARRQAWGDNLDIPGVDAAPAVEAKPAPAAEEEDLPRQPMNRRERRMQEKDTKSGKTEKKTKGAKPKASPVSTNPGTPTTITGPKKKVVAENGKVLVVDSAGNVYLEERNGEGHVHEYLLDPNDMPKPTIRSTALVRLPMWMYKKTAGRFLGAPAEEEYEEYEEEDGAEGVTNVDDYVEVPDRRQGAQKVRSRKNGRK